MVSLLIMNKSNEKKDKNHKTRPEVMIGRSRVTHVHIGQSLFLSLFMGIIYGLATALAGALITFLVSRTSILDKVNGILGSAMQITPHMLYTAFGVLGIMIAIFAAIIIWFKILLFDAAARMFGTPALTIERERRSPVARLDSTDNSNDSVESNATSNVDSTVNDDTINSAEDSTGTASITADNATNEEKPSVFTSYDDYHENNLSTLVNGLKDGDAR